MDTLHRQMLESVRTAMQLTLPKKDSFYHALVVAALIQPQAPAKDLMLIEKLKAKSGLNDIEFFVFSNKDIYKLALDRLIEVPMRDYFVEEARKQGKDIIWFPPSFQRYEGNEIVILSSKVFDELTPEEKKGLKDVSYSMVIAHELGHKYMRKSHIFRVVEDFLNHFPSDGTRQKVAYLYEEIFANEFANLLLSPAALSPKNIANVFRKTKAQLMGGK